jgi:hypothetical protein
LTVRTFTTTWLDLLAREVGYEDYTDYLRSDHWRCKKLDYALSDLPQGCYVCGREDFELHHRDYRCLGNEPLDHLIGLCEDHHYEVHKHLRKGYPGVRLWNAHEKYLEHRPRKVPRPVQYPRHYDPHYYPSG